MKKVFRCFIKNTAFIASMAAVASASLAIISQCNANRVFEYSKKLNKASVSLFDVVAQKEVISEDSLKIRFLFNLSNTGNEPLNILNTSTAVFYFDEKKFQNIYSTQTSINTLHPGAIFNSRASFILLHMDGLKLNTSTIWFDMAIMMKIIYQSPSVTDSVTFYIKCDKYSLNTHHLSRTDYDLMEPFLSDEFRLMP